MPEKAAIYVRSSKDRSDVSLHAQRRELQRLALDRGLAIVAEYADAVESAKDERRPGFQRLLTDLRAQDRPWSYLLAVDTSRLSRRQYMAQVLGHECRKRGVEILYSRLPAADPIADLVVLGVMRVFDELHSLMSREKGLAGMAENVRRGWRAGGRAPRGYRLAKVETGAIRDGKPVEKSILEVDPIEAPKVRDYLRARAEGVKPQKAAQAAGLDLAPASRVSIEWNALVYAGATVWNVHRPRLPDGGHEGGTKRRPRSEWVIQEDTHPAIISREEAEIVLGRLEAAAPGRRQRDRGGRYLLSGLLVTPKGERWWGDGRDFYRVGKGRSVKGPPVEEAVVRQVVEDLSGMDFARAVAAEARRQYAGQGEDPAAPLRAEDRELERRIARNLELAEGLADPAPALRRVDELEARRRAVAAELVELERHASTRQALAGVTASAVHGMLRDLAEGVDLSDRQTCKAALRTLLDRVELDPETLECRVVYALTGADGRVKGVSPGGAGVNPCWTFSRAVGRA